MAAASGAVLARLAHSPAGIDALATRTGLAGDAVAAALVELEREGRIAPLPGGSSTGGCPDFPTPVRPRHPYGFLVTLAVLAYHSPPCFGGNHPQYAEP